MSKEDSNGNGREVKIDEDYSITAFKAVENSKEMDESIPVTMRTKKRRWERKHWIWQLARYLSLPDVCKF